MNIPPIKLTEELFGFTRKNKDVPISVLYVTIQSQAFRTALHFYLNHKKANADFSWQNSYLMPSWLVKVVIFYLWSNTKSRCICPCFLASISSVLCYFVAIWQGQKDLLKNTSISLSLIKHGYPVTIGSQPNKNCMKYDFWTGFSELIILHSVSFPLINLFFKKSCWSIAKKKKKGEWRNVLLLPLP